MAVKIVWSKKASLKFDQIVTYLLDEWGENVILILFFDNRQNPNKKKL